MRVVHVSKVKGIAGSEGHLLRLLPALRQRGVDARMVVLVDWARGDGGFADAMRDRGIDTDVVRILRHVDPLVAMTLARRLLALAPDIVHTHLVHADLYGLWAARLAGVRHSVSSSHNIDAFRRTAAFKRLMRHVALRPDRVVAISDAVAAFVKDAAGARPARVVTINYGLEPDGPAPLAREEARRRLGLCGDGPIVGVTARLVAQKGVDLLLDAFGAVAAAVPDTRLCVVGDGPLRDALERQAGRLGLAGRVRFTGWLAHAGALMPACDLMVVPSRFEGFGLVALEAMAARRPIVAARVDALAEIVADGTTGRLVPAGDAPALAAAVIELLRDPARARSMGEAGYARLVERFSVGRMADQTLAVYAGLVAGRAP
jgi:glycosyltransferase involved in cell wall biosynthesis